ncbi:MAG: hypothetical protein U9R60_18830 [Bacteroidota bacterium]|nr:hypothetical protein [Bacteroidota bacterium]
MMKKTILSSLLILCFLVICTIDGKAQWSIDVEYDTTYCDCGDITERIIDWELWDEVTSTKIEYGQDDVTGTWPYTVPGTATLIYDAQDRYRFDARITFKDPNQCCSGYNSNTYDGDELVDGTETIVVYMN